MKVIVKQMGRVDAMSGDLNGIQNNTLEDCERYLSQWVSLDRIKEKIGKDGVRKVVLLGGKLQKRPLEEKPLRLIVYRSKPDPLHAGREFYEDLLRSEGIGTEVQLYIYDYEWEKVVHMQFDTEGTETKGLSNVPLPHVFFGDPDVHGRMLVVEEDGVRFQLGGLFH